MGCNHVWDSMVGFGTHCIKCGKKKIGGFRKKYCPNCMGQNAKTGYVESWDGRCPDCGRNIRKKGAL